MSCGILIRSAVAAEVENRSGQQAETHLVKSDCSLKLMTVVGTDSLHVNHQRSLHPRNTEVSPVAAAVMLSVEGGEGVLLAQYLEVV